MSAGGARGPGPGVPAAAAALRPGAGGGARLRVPPAALPDPAAHRAHGASGGHPPAAPGRPRRRRLARGGVERAPRGAAGPAGGGRRRGTAAGAPLAAGRAAAGRGQPERRARAAALQPVPGGGDGDRGGAGRPAPLPLLFSQRLLEQRPRLLPAESLPHRGGAGGLSHPRLPAEPWGDAGAGLHLGGAAHPGGQHRAGRVPPAEPGKALGTRRESGGRGRGRASEPGRGLGRRIVTEGEALGPRGRRLRSSVPPSFSTPFRFSPGVAGEKLPPWKGGQELGGTSEVVSPKPYTAISCRAESRSGVQDMLCISRKGC